MRYPLRVFELSRKAPHSASGKAIKFPVPHVDADTVDEARKKAQEAVRSAGRELRGLACAADGSLSITVHAD